MENPLRIESPYHTRPAGCNRSYAHAPWPCSTKDINKVYFVADFPSEKGLEDTAPAAPSEIDDEQTVLPAANIQRIMRDVMPVNQKICKKTRGKLQRQLSCFVDLLTATCAKKCIRERDMIREAEPTMAYTKRAAINGDDVLWAVNASGFQAFDAPLRNLLYGYRVVDESNKDNA